MKRLVILILLTGSVMSLLIISSCKKDKHYSISDTMKQYFCYQKGSYWIYKDDLTGSLDSTYVKDYFYHTDLKQPDGVTTESIEMYFNSKFLSEFVISYEWCAGPDYFILYSILNPLPPEGSGDGAVAYYPGWPANQTIKTTGCETYGYFYYTKFPEMTINDSTYNTIIFSKNQTLDTLPSNPYLFVRSVYFAKNIGIIKYIENDNYYKVHRSYSLLRYKVIQ
jgi:hypothetical protein